jgi:hypothetical protein
MFSSVFGARGDGAEAENVFDLFVARSTSSLTTRWS